MLSTLRSKGGGGEGSKGGRVERKGVEDKYSIKNLIFMAQRPNYVIPVDTEGHKVFFCIDCGDRFVCESSYNYHVNRRSVKITYTCRNCLKTMVFMNRCNLLSHIRSHVYKTATINLMDLKVEPLPIEDMVFGLFHLNGALTMEQVVQAEKELQMKKGLAQTSDISVDQVSTTSDLSEDLSVIEDDSEKKVKRRKRGKRKIKCLECNALIAMEDNAAKTRAKHYMATKGLYEFNCLICTFKALTRCSLNAHFRMHRQLCHNCICPECGEYIHKKHNCRGYMQIKMAARAFCPIEGCGLLQMVKFRSHYLEHHLKAVYKCCMCSTACLTSSTMWAHMTSKHPGRAGPPQLMIYYQCSLCPGRLVLKQYVNSHIDTHRINLKVVYPCSKCGSILNTVTGLLEHDASCIEKKKTGSYDCQHPYLVVKRCTSCTQNFTFHCVYSEIKNLPNTCPNKCMTQIKILECTAKCKSDLPAGQKSNKNENKVIQCPICKMKLNMLWDVIKKHFSMYHKNHQCVDVKVVLDPIKACKKPVSVTNVEGFKKRKIPNTAEGPKVKKRQRKISSRPLQSKEEKNENLVTEINYAKYTCQKCGDSASKTRESFKSHILIHRDPSTAYQCMECGCCFVVKPSFSTHLFVAHGIRDADHYIETNDCYNEDAFNDVPNTLSEEPLKENQCKICREEFNNEVDLDKHFRVHGMAFLMTKKLKKHRILKMKEKVCTVSQPIN